MFLIRMLLITCFMFCNNRRWLYIKTNCADSDMTKITIMFSCNDVDCLLWQDRLSVSKV